MEESSRKEGRYEDSLEQFDFSEPFSNLSTETKDPFDHLSLGSDMPSFFQNSSFDDKKYESLLADLRAHDLLGTDEKDTNNGNGEFLMGGLSNSLFFNDSYSAIFRENVHDTAPFNTDNEKDASTAWTVESAPYAHEEVQEPKPAANPPPPGFDMAEPGNAPTQTDLEWARGQHEFQRLQEQYRGMKHSKEPTKLPPGFEVAPEAANTTNLLAPDQPGKRSEEEAFDFDQAHLMSLKSLGIDDEDASHSGTPVKREMPQPPTQQEQTGAVGSVQQQSTMPNTMPPPQGGSMPGQSGPGVSPPPPPPMHAPPSNPNPGFVQPHPSTFTNGPGQYPQGGGYAPRQHGPQYRQYPRFKRMTQRDIQFVLQQQMKLIRTSDPFSDDYYFHNIMQKYYRSMHGGPSMPLPSWTLQHMKSFDPRDMQRANKSRSWETQNHVLGRNNQTSLYKPREILNLASIRSKGEMAESEDKKKGAEKKEEEEKVKVLSMPSEKKKHSVFSNESWSKRHRIEKGLLCLLSLQDARHILDARGINVQQFHQLETSQIDPALSELRSRSAALLLDLASILGVYVDNTDELQTNPETITSSMKCNQDVLYQLLSVDKGRRLVARALPLLPPSARFVLLPVLLEYMIGANSVYCIPQNPQSDEAATDDRVAQALVVIFLYHTPSPPASVLVHCLELAIMNQTPQTLSHVLHNRPRAEVFQALLQKGGSVMDSSDVPSEIRSKWESLQQHFVQLATAVKSMSAAST